MLQHDVIHCSNNLLSADCRYTRGRRHPSLIVSPSTRWHPAVFFSPYLHFFALSSLCAVARFITTARPPRCCCFSFLFPVLSSLPPSHPVTPCLPCLFLGSCPPPSPFPAATWHRRHLHFHQSAHGLSNTTQETNCGKTLSF